ncbi:MAG: hypothetical protein AAGN66_19475 [Acidobacteriota bacterium]
MQRFSRVLCLSILSASVAVGGVNASPAESLGRGISAEIGSAADLAATGDWTEVSEGVWQRIYDDGAQAEAAFGAAALEKALDHLDGEILSLSKAQTRQQKIHRMELELRRDELLGAAEELLASGRATSQQGICSGQATFNHWYGPIWFFTEAVRSTTSYGEPGPVSPYTKTAYASAKACTSTGYCDTPAPQSASTGSFGVSVNVEASIGPVSSAPREAFGYVLVAGACTEVRSFSSSVPN